MRRRDMTLRADAGRYECGTLNTIGCFGLARCPGVRSGGRGVDRIAPAGSELGRCDRGWRLDAKGTGSRAPRTERERLRDCQRHSGRHEIDCRLIIRQLKERAFLPRRVELRPRVAPLLHHPRRDRAIRRDFAVKPYQSRPLV